MPNTKQARMEDVSVAYVQAVCAQNGYSMGPVARDNDGIDVTITCAGYPDVGCKRISPTLAIQLKASYSKFTQLASWRFFFCSSSKEL